MLQHVSVCERAATPVAVDPLTSLLESPTHETTASPHREHQAYTKPAPMPKPMHAHTKHERPTAKRSAATNDTSLTNDQRNTLDHAMPVHAPPYTHTSTPRAVPCAFAFAMPTLPQSAALCVILYSQLRRQARPALRTKPAPPG